MIKNDIWIKEMARSKGIIDPFETSQVRNGKISFGLSSFGYDFRVSDEFWLPRPMEHTDTIDPKALQDDSFETIHTKVCLVPPASFVMAKSLEYFRIPREILGICTGKSTYARCGLQINITPLEPEWEGHLTFSILNPTPLPIRVYAEEGIAQVLFLEGDPPETSYADRKGKYQAQRGITLPKV
jgi:dCTP deaminase